MSRQIVNIDLGIDFEDGVEKKAFMNTLLTKRIRELNKGKCLTDLNLSFPITDAWPIDCNEIDMSTLVVLAHKLELKIIIGEIELVKDADL